MKGITKLKINQFKIKQLGYDFMGFTIKRPDECTAHHLIIPARHNGKLTDWNTVILNGETSHPYWHLIENKSPDIAYAITSEMSVTDIRKAIKESKNISIGVKQSESTEKANDESTENTESVGTTFDENGNVESVNGRKNVITDAESHISLCIKGVRCGDIDTENSEMALDIAMVLYKYGYKVIVDTLVDNGIITESEIMKSADSLDETSVMIWNNLGRESE